MSWDKDTQGILNRLVAQWGVVTAALRDMRPGAQMEPEDGHRVFEPSETQDANVVAFRINPTVFKLPERANDVSLSLYVVVEGAIGLRRDSFVQTKALVTDYFKTRSAYFRYKGATPDHIYGAHYDFSLDAVGHPAFHSQMRSFPGLWAWVEKRYGVEGTVRNRIEGVLETVRLPSAQMDIFSFVLQLYADHLLFKDSGPEVRRAFNELLTGNIFLQGAGFQAGRLQAAHSCYRALHWYPLVH
ncbi:MAG TPA: hypothetical protein VHY84_04680 [Bryobacteraceae bacterium]|jgi:hypothetical protein|nr:hypothetical protein [Bryobacteraceae bacterium]